MTPDPPSLRLRTSRPPRVVITGVGIWTALGGPDQEGGWRGLKAGRSALAHLSIPGYAGATIAAPRGRAVSLAEATATAAYLDAFPTPSKPIDAERVGVVFGMSKGEISRLAALHEHLRSGTEGRPGLDDWPSTWPNCAASALARLGSFRGPCLSPVAACATGLVAALQGGDLIRRGACDVVLTGAVDASLDPFLLGAFRKMGVLARLSEGEHPRRAVRPWDKGRSGFLVGEGAAVLVLEREDHARARGAIPYCEFAGGAFEGDAYHLTTLNPDPSNLAGLIGRALKYADVDLSALDHVNVHGTATRGNDPLECRALRLALGTAADGVSCSANKAQIGHLLGAAGAVELAFTALAVRDGFVPPTMNLDDPDPACDLDGTPHVGRARPIRAALKLSIGFGGHLAAAVLRQADSPRRPTLDSPA